MTRSARLSEISRLRTLPAAAQSAAVGTITTSHRQSHKDAPGRDREVRRSEGRDRAARLGLAAGIANAEVPGAGVLDPISIEQLVSQIGVASI